MEFWHKIWLGLADPFRYPVDAAERIYFGYLASALVFAVFVYQYLRRQRPDAVPDSIFAYLFPKRIYLHKSAIADYKFFLVDRIVFALLLPAVLLYIRPIIKLTVAGLDQWFGPVQAPWDALNVWVLIAATASQVLVSDFLLFYVHYLFHKIPTLWEFHKVHHSAEVMTPITAYRVHPFELALTMNVTGIAAGLVYGFFSYMTAGGQPEFKILGINVVVFLFYVVAFNLRHSHVPLGYGGFISQVFVSPWMHQVHHSRETRHLDKNMGFIFSFWDRMFGTLHVPVQGETFDLGLTDGEHARFHSVPALYFRPVANLLRRWFKPARPA